MSDKECEQTPALPVATGPGWISGRAAARRLRTTPYSVARCASVGHIRVGRIPAYRLAYWQADVERLAVQFQRGTNAE